MIHLPAPRALTTATAALLRFNKPPSFHHPPSTFKPSRRNFAAKAATAGDTKQLTSAWGEVQVGNETLNEHVYKDIKLWMDKPAVVSLHNFYLIFRYHFLLLKIVRSKQVNNLV